MVKRLEYNNFKIVLCYEMRFVRILCIFVSVKIYTVTCVKWEVWFLSNVVKSQKLDEWRNLKYLHNLTCIWCILNFAARLNPLSMVRNIVVEVIILILLQIFYQSLSNQGCCCSRNYSTHFNNSRFFCLNKSQPI